MAIAKGAFSSLLKPGDLLKAMEKEFKQIYMNDFSDSLAYSQLSYQQNQMAQQYANQYNQGMLGQLGQGAQAYNGLGNISSTWDDYMKKYQAAQAKSLMPAPKVNKKAENEIWLDSKIAEISYAL